MTMELTQSLGSSTFLMTLLFPCQSTFYYTLLRNVTGIFFGGFMTGITELSILILYGLSKHTSTKNTFESNIN